MSARWWWGTYPEAGLGTPTGLGEGLWGMVPGGSESSLALTIPAPSFVIAHPDLPLVYVVTEQEKSTVACIDVADPAEPAIVDEVVTGGSGACHVLLARDTLTLYVSHYTSGEVAVVPLTADGRLAVTAPIQLLPGSGSGLVPRRQEGPHAHFAGYSPSGSTLLVADLGTDELRRYEVLVDGSLRADGVAAGLPPGSGPRHFAVRGELVYVLCELDHTLKTLSWDEDSRTATLVSTLPSTPVPLRSGDGIYDAHIVVVNDVVLASVRGCDVISVFDLDSQGLPLYRSGFDSGGEHPRHFAVLGERLVVGNEKSHLVSLFDLADVLALEPGGDPTEPARLPHTDAKVLSPACVCSI
ncbi:MAG: beta-propeller fold lactonase family protein [Demequinaceae bacterium]|nr:beta-propeller fold lactonase family protein [Demequinaceae bacterium]